MDRKPLIGQIEDIWYKKARVNHMAKNSTANAYFRNNITQ